MNDDKKIIPKEVSALANKVKYDNVIYRGTLDGKDYYEGEYKLNVEYYKKTGIALPTGFPMLIEYSEGKAKFVGGDKGVFSILDRLNPLEE